MHTSMLEKDRSETNTGPRRKKHGAGIKITQKYRKNTEMPPVTFVGSLYNTHAVPCLKISDVHGLEVHDVRTWKVVNFRKIFLF